MLQFSTKPDKMDTQKVVIKTVYPVYISMTTIPSRMGNTIKIIKNTLKHVEGIEQLILNVCDSYKEVHKSPITHHMEELQKIDDPRFRLNVTYDIGPITKLVPSLRITPKECVLIICDDDCYHHEAFKIIAEKQDKEHDKSFTFFKYDYGKVEVPQGVDLVSFWKPNLEGFMDFFNKANKDKSCFFVDDLVVGFFLNRKGIEIKQLDRLWRWPWIPSCLPKEGKQESLFGRKGDYSRKKAMKKCMMHLL